MAVKRKLVKVLGLGSLLLLVLVFGFGTLIGLGFFYVRDASVKLQHGEYKAAQENAKLAKSFFGIFNFTTGQKVADLEIQASDLAPILVKLARSFLTESGNYDLNQDRAKIQSGVMAIDANLEYLEKHFEQFVPILNLAGVSAEKTQLYKSELSEVRKFTGRIDQFLELINGVTPFPGETKTFLVVFQNNAELWPTGGFIGSYAIVKLPFGKPLEYRIYDVYDADGQLPGHIDPPDEILHYLGDYGWFLRSANWSPDFPLTAQRLEWFLEKETGMKVDGVVGINLGLVQKILSATGPIKIQNGDSVTSENFFEKAEYASEINYFPGSRQKAQYLSQVAEVLFHKLAFGEGINWFLWARAFGQGILEKDILVYLNSTAAQQTVHDLELDGSLTREGCSLPQANCLMLVETNFGANKANYFVKRNVGIIQTILTDGTIDTKVSTRWKNASPNNSWPGGDYKNYLRWFVPQDADRLNFDLGDTRNATVSPILTASVKDSVLQNQFLVVQSSESGQLNFGTFIKIPVKQERKANFSYQLQRSNSGYRFVFLKQPGVEETELKYVLNYPSTSEIENLKTSGVRSSALMGPGKITFKTKQFSDVVVDLRFK